MRLHIERFTKTSCAREEIEPVSTEIIMSKLASSDRDWSSTLRLERSETEQLFLTVSQGRYAVLERRGDDFYDLVGDATAIANVEFVHGGQAAPHPARHTVPRQLAVDAATAYMIGRAEAAGALVWERQRHK
jgi:hypothetical protein